MSIKRPESAVVAQMRAALQERLAKARAQFEQGKREMAEGNVMKASAALQLASSYDPQNEEYAQIARQAQAQARKVQSKQFITQAEAAESYQNLKDALAWYRKAVEYGSDDGKAYYRAAMISRKLEPEEKRAHLELLRNAVRFSPGQPDFHLALGQLYAELDMKLNARRELEAVLKVRKDHVEAREALKRLPS
jgi:tetratricopeptide (TPR) repeat protein